VLKATSRSALTDRLSIGLLALTAVSGIVDAVSFLGLGHIFTANMTGNVVFLAFAAVGTPGISIARSITALGAFLSGAVIGGYFCRGIAGPLRRHSLRVCAASEAARWRWDFETPRFGSSPFPISRRPLWSP